MEHKTAKNAMEASKHRSKRFALYVLVLDSQWRVRQDLNLQPSDPKSAFVLEHQKVSRRIKVCQSVSYYVDNTIFMTRMITS